MTLPYSVPNLGVVIHVIQERALYTTHFRDMQLLDFDMLSPDLVSSAETYVKLQELIDAKLSYERRDQPKARNCATSLLSLL